jgi:hypothetical protein
VTVGEGSTASVAVTVKFTLAPEALVASTVWFAGTFSVGAVVSWTVTVNVSVVVPSLLVQVTVVVPTGKNESDAGLHSTVGSGSWSSVAETK